LCVFFFFFFVVFYGLRGELSCAAAMESVLRGTRRFARFTWPERVGGPGQGQGQGSPFDEARSGLQWALWSNADTGAAERHRAPPRAESGRTGSRPALLGRLPFELTQGQRDVADLLSTETRVDPADAQDAAGRGRIGQDDRLGCWPCCKLGRRRLPVRTARAPRKSLAAQHVRSIRDVLGPLGHGRPSSAAAEGGTRVALLTGIDDPRSRKARRVAATKLAAGEGQASSSARTRSCRTPSTSTGWAMGGWSTNSTGSAWNSGDRFAGQGHRAALRRTCW